MWDGVGVERDAAGLAAAAAALDAVAHGDDVEAANLLLVARLAAAAADIRTESRGAHYRSDFPLPDPAQARRIAWAGGQPYLVPPARRSSRAFALEAA
jgi:L-aspartate oxidase